MSIITEFAIVTIAAVMVLDMCIGLYFSGNGGGPDGIA